MVPELSDIFAGVVGGIIVAFLGWTITQFRQFREKLKFPIEGEYITYFEDIENGKSVTVTSISTIKQKGLKIIGKNIQADGRSWTIDGNIVGTGHIAGVYSADATYDEGVGSFYLKINGDNLDGMWSGYDNKNRITASGRYLFRKKAKIEISSATESDIPNILNLSIPLFGEGYVKDISDFINNKKGVALIARENATIVGYVLAKDCERDESVEIFGNSEKVPADIRHSDWSSTLGLIKTIGILPERQGYGIGEALFKKAELELKQKGVKIVVVPAWITDDKENIDGLMKHFGYIDFLQDNGYWKVQCENEEFHCPMKTEGHCVCGVKFYKKSL